MEQIKVFYVNKGHLLTFEIGTLQTLGSVQEKIEREVRIAIKDQIWMLNDGVLVEFDKKLQDYANHGGADKSPFFIYEQRRRDNNAEMMYKGDLKEIADTVDAAIEKTMRIKNTGNINEIFTDLPNITLDHCGKTAVLIYDWCNQLVNDHTLLTMSWQAIMCNIENTLNLTKKKYRNFKKKYDSLDLQLSKAHRLGKCYSDCLNILKQIILPAKLLAHSKGMRTTAGLKSLSLYDWLDMSDPNNCLEDLIQQLLDQYGTMKDSGDKPVLDKINFVDDQTKNRDLRDICGITRRMQNLKQNQVKASEILDRIKQNIQYMTSPAPPISDTNMIHAKVDDYMRTTDSIFQDLRKLKEYCITFRKSKEELIANINARIHGWIITAYDRLNRANNEMTLFNERYEGLDKRMDLIDKIEAVPNIFVSGVTEIVRRNVLRRHFVEWQTSYIKLCDKLFEEEKQRRDDFAKTMNNHFLRVLFRGLTDSFPEFYQNNVAQFDTEMPPLDENYLEILSEDCESIKGQVNVEVTETVQKVIQQIECLNDRALQTVPDTPTTSKASSRETFDVSSVCSHFANRLSLSDPKCSVGFNPVFKNQESQSSLYFSNIPRETLSNFKIEVNDLTKELNDLKTDFKNNTSTILSDIESIVEISKNYRVQQERNETKKKIIEPEDENGNADVVANTAELKNIIAKQSEEIAELKKLLEAKTLELNMFTSTMNNQEENQQLQNITDSRAKLTREASISTSMLFLGNSESVMGKSVMYEKRDSDFMQQSKITCSNEALDNGDKTTQTKLNFRSMEMMISLHDISEGATVLIVYDERYQAFLLFSSSPYLHFVKESSLRRMNLMSPNGPVRTWFLGRVNSLDLCVIKKVNNRYNLALDTRVYRVDVSSVLLDVRGQSTARVDT